MKPEKTYSSIEQKQYKNKAVCSAKSALNHAMFGGENIENIQMNLQ